MKAPKSVGDSIRQRFLRGSAWVLAGKGLAIVLQVLVNAFLARLLGPGQLGGYFLVFSIASFGGTVSILGMERAVVRLVAAALGTGQPGRARAAVRTVWMFGVFGTATMASVLILGFGRFLANHVFHSPVVGGVMVFAAGWLVATGLQTLLAETYRGFQRFLAATIVDGLVAYGLGATVFAVLFLLKAHPTLGQVVVLSMSFTSGTLLVGGLILSRRVVRLQGPGHVDRREVWSLAWPLLVVNLTSFMVGTGVDLFVVGAFRPRTDVALYGAASRLVFFLATPFIIVSQVVPPIIAELWAQGKKKELEHSLRSIATLAGLPAAMLLLTFLFFGGHILGAIFGHFYRQGALVLAILSVARLVAVGTGSCGAALMMTGHQRDMMNLSLFAGVLSVGSEILLAPHFGIVGVAVATALAQTLQNVLMLIFARKRLGIWTHAELSLRPVKELLFGSAS
jgi:O-antigen/teichoic acid export membrane protein